MEQLIYEINLFKQLEDEEEIGTESGQNEVKLSNKQMPAHKHTFNLNNGGNGTKRGFKWFILGERFTKLDESGSRFTKSINKKIKYLPD